jgi:hypothetical protein
VNWVGTSIGSNSPRAVSFRAEIEENGNMSKNRDAARRGPPVPTGRKPEPALKPVPVTRSDDTTSPVAKKLIAAAYRAGQKLDRSLRRQQSEDGPVTAAAAHGIGAALVAAFSELAESLRSAGVSSKPLDDKLADLSTVSPPDDDRSSLRRPH